MGWVRRRVPVGAEEKETEKKFCNSVSMKNKQKCITLHFK